MNMAWWLPNIWLHNTLKKKSFKRFKTKMTIKETYKLNYLKQMTRENKPKLLRIKLLLSKNKR